MSNCSIAASILVSTLLIAGCGAGSNVLRQAGGPLAACDEGPHCVSSTSSNAEHRVEPLRYTGGVDAARQRLKAALTADGAAVVSEGGDYLHAAYTTALMRYVDDVEFVFATPGRIDLRSSSRVGYYDFDVNRKRVERLRAAFSKAG